MSINNFFNYSKNKFYDTAAYFTGNVINNESLISQNIDIDETFTAEYNYGPKEEQIIQRNIIIIFFQTLLARLFQNYIYPGISLDLNQNRVFQTKEQFKAIGGKFVSMKTPDGDTLEGVYLKAIDFKKSIEKHFSFVKEINNPDGSSKVIFIDSGNREDRRKTFKFKDQLKDLKFADIQYNINYNRDILTINSLFQSNSLLPTIEEKRASNPTVVISGGNGGTYVYDKKLALSYLTRGLDVMLFNRRGYGNSTGIPTSHKTKLDVETVYQYLSKEKQIENKDLLFHGYCLGGGISADLTARRKGTNLLLDRTFSKFSLQTKFTLKDVLDNYLSDFIIDNPNTLWGRIRNRIILYLEQIQLCERVSSLFSRIISLAVDYDNETNVSKTIGNIAIVSDITDQSIHEDAYLRLRQSCLEKKVAFLFTDVGHDSSWLKTMNGQRESSFYSLELNNFLVDSGLYRKVF